MKRRITLSTFRRVSAAEERMLLAVMPRTSAADPKPLPQFAAPPVTVVAWRSGSRLVKPLTVTLAEAAES